MRVNTGPGLSASPGNQSLSFVTKGRGLKPSVPFCNFLTVDKSTLACPERSRVLLLSAPAHVLWSPYDSVRHFPAQPVYHKDIGPRILGMRRLACCEPVHP